MRIINADALKEKITNNCKSKCLNYGSKWCETCCPLNDYIPLLDDIINDLLLESRGTIFNHEYDLREPYPNNYIIAIDNATKMLRCPECNCQIIAYPFSYAVGNRGYCFCPYCGTDLRKEN